MLPKNKGGRPVGSGNLPRTTGQFLILEDEAGADFGLNHAAMKLLRLSGDGPQAIQLGHNFYYKKSDLQNWFGQ
jgi:hypothetical protein